MNSSIPAWSRIPGFPGAASAPMAVARARRAASPALAQSNVDEKDVEVKTADGTCDAVLFHPAGKGTWPAVLIWPDIMGLRPAFRDMGRRLAAKATWCWCPIPSTARPRRR